MNQLHGNNIFCGPAALSIIAGISTDEAEKMIQERRKTTKPVHGAWLSELTSSLAVLGWKYEHCVKVNSLFSFLTLHSTPGYYLITLPGHFVVVEVDNEGRRFFCDNHTKQPINAAASARLSQKVVQAIKVWK